ncbi:acyl-CoA dehydrogenase family protein [Streptomyces sp. NPDC051041]|uniref:acyl-CoA dehydrogenase family protein n=1 Tax=Streptomyces sp. NPDC051041 TaxID=3365640 RepID=UPI003793F773
MTEINSGVLRSAGVSVDGELTSLLEVVRDVVPALRKNGAEAEGQRWIPEENTALLEKAGVFRMAVPRRFGGLGLGVADQSGVIAESARGCPSTGWPAMVWMTSAWAAGLYSDQAQEEVFADGSVRVSIVFAPNGTLVPAGAATLSTAPGSSTPAAAAPTGTRRRPCCSGPMHRGGGHRPGADGQDDRRRRLGRLGRCRHGQHDHRGEGPLRARPPRGRLRGRDGRRRQAVEVLFRAGGGSGSGYDAFGSWNSSIMAA